MVKSFVINGAFFQTDCPTPFALSSHVFRFGSQPLVDHGLSLASGLGHRQKRVVRCETAPMSCVITHGEDFGQIALLAHSLYVLHGCEEGHEDDYWCQATAFWRKQQSEPLTSPSRPRSQ